MNRVLAHTGVRFPIIQAPMGWIARSPLASAVSRAGGTIARWQHGRSGL